MSLPSFIIRDPLPSLLHFHLPLSLRRAALELWKQKLGPGATYNRLIEVFRRAGYENLADTVRSTAGNVLYIVYVHEYNVMVSEYCVICVHNIGDDDTATNQTTHPSGAHPPP